MLERSHEKLAPLPVFLKRMVGSVGIGLALLLVALFIGICGYHWLDGLDWVDSLLEASMILGGMGPINPLTNTSVVFIALMGLLLTPLVHRLMHKFHLKDSK